MSAININNTIFKKMFLNNYIENININDTDLDTCLKNFINFINNKLYNETNIWKDILDTITDKLTNNLYKIINTKESIFFKNYNNTFMYYIDDNSVEKYNYNNDSYDNFNKFIDFYNNKDDYNNYINLIYFYQSIKEKKNYYPFINKLNIYFKIVDIDIQSFITFCIEFKSIQDYNYRYNKDYNKINDYNEIIEQLCNIIINNNEQNFNILNEKIDILNEKINRLNDKIIVQKDKLKNFNKSTLNISKLNFNVDFFLSLINKKYYVKPDELNNLINNQANITDFYLNNKKSILKKETKIIKHKKEELYNNNIYTCTCYHIINDNIDYIKRHYYYIIDSLIIDQNNTHIYFNILYIYKKDFLNEVIGKLKNINNINSKINDLFYQKKILSGGYKNILKHLNVNNLLIEDNINKKKLSGGSSKGKLNVYIPLNNIINDFRKDKDNLDNLILKIISDNLNNIQDMLDYYYKEIKSNDYLDYIYIYIKFIELIKKKYPNININKKSNTIKEKINFKLFIFKCNRIHFFMGCNPTDIINFRNVYEIWTDTDVQDKLNFDWIYPPLKNLIFNKIFYYIEYCYEDNNEDTILGVTETVKLELEKVKDQFNLTDPTRISNTAASGINNIAVSVSENAQVNLFNFFGIKDNIHNFNKLEIEAQELVNVQNDEDLFNYINLTNNYNNRFILFFDKIVTNIINLNKFLDEIDENNFVNDIINNKRFIKVQCFIKYCNVEDLNDQIILRNIETLIKSYSDFFPIESIEFSVSRITYYQFSDYVINRGTKRNVKYLELFLFFKILCDGKFTDENKNLIDLIKQIYLDLKSGNTPLQILTVDMFNLCCNNWNDYEGREILSSKFSIGIIDTEYDIFIYYGNTYYDIILQIRIHNKKNEINYNNKIVIKLKNIINDNYEYYKSKLYNQLKYHKNIIKKIDKSHYYDHIENWKNNEIFFDDYIYLMAYGIGIKTEDSSRSSSKQIIDLKTNEEYDIIDDIKYNNLMKLWIFNLENFIIVKKKDTEIYKLVIFMNNNILKFSNYWCNMILPQINTKETHFLEFTENFLSFKYNNINDFHALFLCLLKNQNTICLQLLQNRIISDVINFDKFDQLSKKYLYTEQILICKNNLDIPFAKLYTNYSENFSTFNFENINYDIPIQILENNRDFIKYNKDPNNDCKFIIVNIYNILSKLSNYISSKNKKINVNNNNKELVAYIKSFRSKCEYVEKDYIESFLTSAKELINFINNFYLNLCNYFDIEIIKYMINIEKNFFDINRLYNKYYLYFYTKIIFTKFKKIYNNLRKEDINQLINQCGEILRIISDLDPLLIYDFTKFRNLKTVIFELHNELFIRDEQQQLVNDFIANNNISTSVYEILMGKGKTSTLTPLYIINKYIEKKYDFIIVLPSHLVKSSYDIINKIIDLFDNYCLNIINDYKYFENSKLYLQKNNNNVNKITVISDVLIKYYCINNIYHNNQINNNIEAEFNLNILSNPNILSKTKTVLSKFNPNSIPVLPGLKELNIQNIFDPDNTVFVFDEIDTLINPLKSYLNLSFEEKKSHDKINYICEVLFDVAINIYNNYNPLKNMVIDTKDKKFDEKFKKIINKISKIAKNYEYNKNYGLSQKKKDIKSEDQLFRVIPYMAINSPVEGSEFSDFELSILLTFLSYINDFQDDDINVLISIIKENIKNLQNLTSKKFFDKIKLSYSYLKLIENNFITFLDLILDNDLDNLDQIKILMRDNPEFLTGIIHFYIDVKIKSCFKYNREKYNISTIDLLDIGITKNKICFSGTVNFNIPNEICNIYEKTKTNNQLQSIISNQSAHGEIYSAITSYTHQMNDRFNQVTKNKEEIEDYLLKYLIDNIKLFNAFIDIGGYILKTKPKDVMIMLRKNLPDRRLLYVNDKNEKTLFIDENTEQKYNNEVYTNLFIYYDNKNCVGTDFKQPYSMNALVTISPKNNLTEVAQGIYRLRNINIGHTVEYFIPDIFFDNTKKSESFNNLYTKLDQVEKKDKDKLKDNMAIQCIKHMRRKNNLYKKDDYKETNYIGSIDDKDETTFIIDELKKNNLLLKLEEIQKIKLDDEDTEINTNVNVNVNVNVNIKINIDINTEINNVLNIIKSIQYKGTTGILRINQYYKFDVNTSFIYSYYFALNTDTFSKIQICEFELVVSPDILSHMEQFKSVSKMTSYDKTEENYKLYFSNLYFMINLKIKKIIIISFYEYYLMNKNKTNDDDIIIFNANGEVENLHEYNTNKYKEHIDLLKSNKSNNLESYYENIKKMKESFYTNKDYKDIAILLFNKHYEPDVIIYTIRKFYNSNQKMDTLINILKILEAILFIKYPFNYKITSEIFNEFKNNSFYKKIYIWQYIFNTYNMDENQINIYITKYETKLSLSGSGYHCKLDIIEPSNHYINLL